MLPRADKVVLLSAGTDQVGGGLGCQPRVADGVGRCESACLVCRRSLEVMAKRATAASERACEYGYEGITGFVRDGDRLTKLLLSAVREVVSSAETERQREFSRALALSSFGDRLIGEIRRLKHVPALHKARKTNEKPSANRVIARHR